MEASAKYQIGQVVPGTILKVNPFGLFVKLDDEIHGLAHVSQLSLDGKDKITDLFKSDEVKDFEIVSISPSEHRLGLKLAEAGAKAKKTKKAGTAKDETGTEEEKSDKPAKAKKVKDETKVKDDGADKKEKKAKTVKKAK